MQAPLIGGGCCTNTCGVNIYCDGVNNGGGSSNVVSNPVVANALPFLSRVTVDSNGETTISGVLNTQTLRVGGSLALQGADEALWKANVAGHFSNLDANVMAISDRVSLVEGSLAASSAGQIVITSDACNLYLKTFNAATNVEVWNGIPLEPGTYASAQDLAVMMERVMNSVSTEFDVPPLRANPWRVTVTASGLLSVTLYPAIAGDIQRFTFFTDAQLLVYANQNFNFGFNNLSGASWANLKSANRVIGNTQARSASSTWTAVSAPALTTVIAESVLSGSAPQLVLSQTSSGNVIQQGTFKLATVSGYNGLHAQTQSSQMHFWPYTNTSPTKPVFSIASNYIRADNMVVSLLQNAATLDIEAPKVSINDGLNPILQLKAGQANLQLSHSQTQSILDFPHTLIIRRAGQTLLTFTNGQSPSFAGDISVNGQLVSSSLSSLGSRVSSLEASAPSGVTSSRLSLTTASRAAAIDLNDLNVTWPGLNIMTTNSALNFWAYTDVSTALPCLTVYRDYMRCNMIRTQRLEADTEIELTTNTTKLYHATNPVLQLRAGTAASQLVLSHASAGNVSLVQFPGSLTFQRNGQSVFTLGANATCATELSVMNTPVNSTLQNLVTRVSTLESGGGGGGSSTTGTRLALSAASQSNGFSMRATDVGFGGFFGISITKAGSWAPWNLAQDKPETKIGIEGDGALKISCGSASNGPGMFYVDSTRTISPFDHYVGNNLYIGTDTKVNVGAVLNSLQAASQMNLATSYIDAQAAVRAGTASGKVFRRGMTLEYVTGYYKVPWKQAYCRVTWDTTYGSTPYVDGSTNTLYQPRYSSIALDPNYLNNLPNLNKTSSSWQIIMKGQFTGSLFDFDLNFNSTLSGWGTGTSGQQGGTDFLVFQDGGRSHSGSSPNVVASSATWQSNLRVYMPNSEGFYLTIQRNAASGKITVSFYMYDGTLLYSVQTLNAIPLTNAAYFHMYVNSGAFKWYKGALVDPAGTATIGEWDTAFDP